MDDNLLLIRERKLHYYLFATLLHIKRLISRGKQIEGFIYDERKPLDRIEKIYNENYSYLRHFLIGLTKNEDVAEDIIQDLSTRILFNPENLFKVSCDRSWLTTCAKNAFLDYYRKKKPSLLKDENIIEQLLINHTSAEKELMVNSQIENVLSKLNATDKAIILAKEYYGYSYSDMCHLFDLTIPNLKLKVFRIKKRLIKSEVKQ